MNLKRLTILIQSAVFSIFARENIQSSQITWNISDSDCDVIQTLGYVLKACRDAQEVHSTTSSTNYVKEFDNKNVLKAFSAREEDSNAFLLQEAGGVYLQILEMQPNTDGIDIKPVGSIKPKQLNSSIIAFYLDKEVGYGFYMHENGVF